MTARIKKICGFNVEIWETSFRVEGMTRPVHVGQHINDEVIFEIISTIYHSMVEQAEQDGRKRAADAMTKLIMES